MFHTSLYAPRPTSRTGSQAVKRLLEYYGQRADLAELIHELQWPDVEMGTSFLDLSQALERRGVFARAVTIPDPVPIQWPYPVVVHFARGPSRHFAVLLPGTQEGQRILWTSGSPSVALPADACLNDRTSIVLLTAPQPITDDQLKTLSNPRHGLFAFALLLPLLPSGLAGLLLYRLLNLRPSFQGKER